MITKKLSIIVLGCALTTYAFAGSIFSTRGYDDRPGWPFVATLSFGPAWSRPGEAELLAPQPLVSKSFIPFPASRKIKLISTAKRTETLFTGELFLGLYGYINSVVMGQLGVAVAGSSQVGIKGTVFEDSNINFGNFIYSYGVRHVRGALKAKLIYDPNYYDIYPYLSGSAGVGYNHSSGFAIRSRLFQEIPAPLFLDNSESAFSFTIGTGIETYFDDNWRVGLGYEFADWGESHLGPAIAQTLGKGPGVSSLRTHGLLISVSYLS